MVFLLSLGWILPAAALPEIPIADRVVIKLAMYHNPPYYFTENIAEPRGLSLDLIKPAARQLGFQIQVITCPFARCLKMAEHGEVDIVAGLIKSPSREQYLYFMEPAMMRFNSSFVFYSRKDFPKQVRRLNELRDYSVAVMRDAVYFPEFDGAGFIKKVPVSTESAALELVHKGRVDFAIMVEQTASGSFANANIPANELIKQPYHVQQKIYGYLAFSRNAANFSHAQELEDMMLKQYQTGLFHLIWQKYQLPTNP